MPVMTHGAGAYAGPNAIGGKLYNNIITDGDYVVGNMTEFLMALNQATAGQIVFIDPSANIDLGGGTTGTLSLAVRNGITIASNRGKNGSMGGRLYWSLPSTLPRYKTLFTVGDNVTLNGFRLQGPDGEIGSSGAEPTITGITSSGKKGLTIENMEIYNWPYGGIGIYNDGGLQFDDPQVAKVLFSHIHHCRRQGLGYGVQIGWATAKIIGCIIDYTRHCIAGERSYPDRSKFSSYLAMYNILGPNVTNTLGDMHGGNDDSSMGFSAGPDPTVAAGGIIRYLFNDFLSTTQPSVGIRGIPEIECIIKNNWTKWLEQYSATAFNQQLKRLGYPSNAPPYVKMIVEDNWFGPIAPPEEGGLMIDLTVNLKEVNGTPVPGKPIVIQIARPDAGQDTLNLVTDAAGAASEQYAGFPGLGYEAQAFFAGDSEFDPAQSTIQTFGIERKQVILTLTVTST